MPRVAEGTSTLLHEAFGFALPKGLYTDMSKEVEGRLCDLLSCLPLAVGGKFTQPSLSLFYLSAHSARAGELLLFQKCGFGLTSLI